MEKKKKCNTCKWKQSENVCGKERRMNIMCLKVMKEGRERENESKCVCHVMLYEEGRKGEKRMKYLEKRRRKEKEERRREEKEEGRRRREREGERGEKERKEKEGKRRREPSIPAIYVYLSNKSQKKKEGRKGM